jgi:hypothetical protein
MVREKGCGRDVGRCGACKHESVDHITAVARSTDVCSPVCVCKVHAISLLYLLFVLSLVLLMHRMPVGLSCSANKCAICSGDKVAGRCANPRLDW